MSVDAKVAFQEGDTRGLAVDVDLAERAFNPSIIETAAGIDAGGQTLADCVTWLTLSLQAGPPAMRT